MKKLQWHTEKRIVNNLIPYEGNPRKMSEEQVKQLRRSLEKFNLVEIPAIDLDNKIIAGHQRLKIMQLLNRGNEEVDVRVPNRKLTDDEFREYNLRSNKNLGDWDFDELANYDENLLLEAGFSEEEINRKMNLDLEEDIENEEEIDEYKRIHILISIDPDYYDEINEELQIIRNKITGKGEYEQAAN
jgi:ParB-like chromosome segregation protein Spo0J